MKVEEKIACYLFMHREAGEELQMAEVKLAMHKEMLGKDEVHFDERRKYQVFMATTLHPGDHQLEEQPCISVNRARAAGRRSRCPETGSRLTTVLGKTNSPRTSGGVGTL